ncbi:FtsB family cell division protein [Arthrobacter sp. P2b]|jgi:cell division protein FtsB|uniref:FtsB family cell division protein n=1 Tax=Arthrobacter sp. P2b TaxID=1938741 RepID=UPI0009A5A64E|nr:septum formation initiator family protein [Arthrobacter sp. P2b]SLJ94174.1 Cell division protein FtsB [Arthrobacter sp. P2b]
MATRRPKVPKVAPTRQARETSDGAEIIQADFRSGKDKAGQEVHAGRAGGAATGSASTGKAGSVTAGSRPKAGAPAGSKGSSAAAGAAEPAAGEDQHPVPAKAFSGRMLALAVVMIAITVMLAPTVKIFFDKKAEIDALNADIAAREAEGDVLRQQVSRWQDPNYVKQQARDRINMVMPGETGYWVFGSDVPAGETSGQSGAAAQDPADLPWVDSLWESITRAATD